MLEQRQKITQRMFIVPGVVDRMPQGMFVSYVLDLLLLLH